MSVEQGSWDAAIQVVGEWVGGLSALMVSFVAWLGRYHVRRLDAAIVEVSEMRERYVTRDELIATLTRSEQFASDRLGRIEGKIDENAKESKTDRREMYARINEVATGVATLTGRADASTEIATAISKLAKGG